MFFSYYDYVLPTSQEISVNCIWCSYSDIGIIKTKNNGKSTTRCVMRKYVFPVLASFSLLPLCKYSLARSPRSYSSSFACFFPVFM